VEVLIGRLGEEEESGVKKSQASRLAKKKKLYQREKKTLRQALKCE